MGTVQSILERVNKRERGEDSLDVRSVTAKIVANRETSPSSFLRIRLESFETTFHLGITREDTRGAGARAMRRRRRHRDGGVTDERDTPYIYIYTHAGRNNRDLYRDRSRLLRLKRAMFV